MVQVSFGDGLKDELTNQRGARATTALNSWYVQRVALGGKPYYLYVEKETGLPVITKDLKSFGQVLREVFYACGFLAQKQGKISERANATYQYHPAETSPFFAKYRRVLNEQGKELVAGMKEHPTWSDILVMRDLSIQLADRLEGSQGIPVLPDFSRVVNAKWPVKVNKPKPGTRYCTITPDFKDPRDWQSFNGQPVADNQMAVRGLRSNNEKMIAQFLKSELGQGLMKLGPRERVAAVLSGFLTDFLLADQIQLFTSNVAVANQYLWMILRVSGDNFPVLVLDSFFEFLSLAGIVTKPAAKRVAEDLDETWNIFNGNGDDERSQQLDDMEAETAEFQRDPVAFMKKHLGADADLFAGNSQPDLGAFQPEHQLPQPKRSDRPLINPANRDKIYEISAQLEDYKPRMSRKFRVGGGISMAVFQVAIITMFNGIVSHMFDLENPKTGEMYMLPDFNDDPYMQARYTIIDADAATVSMLNQGDKLTLHYDYGDGWEFKLIVRAILDEPGDPRPVVTMARGYGIIDDIGGPAGLEEYRRDFKRGKVPADVKEWLGDELIDPDQAEDLEDINESLRFFLQDDH